MTYGQRLSKLLFSVLVFVVVWLSLMAWDSRGVPPREELEPFARAVGFVFILLLVIETVIHLVRRRRA